VGRAALRFRISDFRVPIVDPANPKNVLSDDLSGGAKKAIAKAARSAIYDENWKKVIW
jgi:hypothetical protein